MISDEFKAKYWMSVSEFWHGCVKLSDKLANRAYFNNNMGLYHKYNRMFWTFSEKFHRADYRATTIIERLKSIET